MWRSIAHDPLRQLPKPTGWRERFTRHQLKPVLILEDVLTARMDRPATLAVLGDVVAHSGARFVASQVRHPAPAVWRKFTPAERDRTVAKLLSRFGNAEAHVVSHDDVALGFDVTFCHFVALCRQLGRPHLAPLFCKADSTYYDAPDSPVRLVRTQTLAAGDDRCTFRLSYY